ncbi:DUF1996 domain-containing protein [Streptomyces virens]|uniref:DUF1996 domain-containing protein n=1 Tax=Streptomyces virens TaxID=285572 RepID=A0ABP6PXX4_9ACTN|nr:MULTISPECIES: DUF1996 domain-containing protein [Streptomyces]MBA8976515.1 hypothetical protein [Streptomyces calvus]MYS28464.1 DUF1996 domain-containing protein [Streptomyces sp. SID7804]
MAANVYASATVDDAPAGGAGRARVLGGATIDCSDVATRLTSVPERARPEVDKELAALDEQIAQAYRRLGESAEAVRQDPGFADERIVEPLGEERSATLERIVAAIDAAGDRPAGLEELADCTVRDSGNASAPPADGRNGGEQDGSGQDDGGQDGGGQDGEQGQGGNGGQAGNGPVAADYADITGAPAAPAEPERTEDASRGTFTSSCGVNENGLFNSDNVIAAPGVANGAHHFHDYIGNQATNAFSSDDDLAKADTSCEDPGDRSSYYWPVLRLQNGTQEQDAASPGGGIEGNAGEIVTPKEVTLTFVGNPRGEVTAMPRLLRIITGDAKSFVNGPANANASWSCTGFEDRQLKDKYPLCPQGSDVVRTFRFQSCWDGRNIDSANHRTHMAFTAADGSCPSGFRPVPQLVQRIVYDVDAPSLDDGGRTTPLFAVDSFPEQLHKPVTDHGDFINVFDEDLMREMVGCINSGRTCGAGADGGEQPGGEQPGGEEPGGEQSQEPTAAPENPGDGGDGGDGEGGDAGEQPGGGRPENPSEPPATEQPADEQPATEQPADEEPATEEPATREPATEEPAGESGAPGDGGDRPEVRVSPSAEENTEATGTGADNGDGDNTGDANAGNDDTGDGNGAPVDDGTEPQAVTGGLAETGAQLWPAAAGAVLVTAGVVVLRRVRRT